MKRLLALLGLVLSFMPLASQAAWNADWTSQKKISINAQGITPAVAQFPVLVRLHSGNFDFTTANIDGSDIRFIAADDKTELKYHIEKYDAVNELAVIWVQVPKLDAAEKDAHFWLYSGNEKVTASTDTKTSLDANAITDFHFSEKALLQDSSASGLVATGEIAVQKAGLIAESATFTGKPLVIPANPAIKQAVTGAYTWSAWIKPATLPQQAALYSQGDAISLKMEDQKLSLKIGANSISGGEIKAATWQHVAFTLEGGKANIYINGISVGSGDASVAEVTADITVGDAFTGEMDELEIANVARNAEWIKLAASSQGVDSQLLKVAESSGDEGDEEGGEPNYIKILIDSLTPDAKVVIGILAIMFVISMWVMFKKAMLVSVTDKDNKKFLARFQKTTGDDLLSLDKNVNYPNSTLFKLYQAGLREIKKRQHEGEALSLSGAAMDAIKAAIDADLVRETQRQNAGMVLLTIAISGGPFLGLLGTVVGVMITFAAIAAAGDVNVNAIAPGIAAALLATVAGLAVAIPALFGYNYLASRIKNITISMQIFVDEFVTRSAELYGKN
jgi:biopolymer transport protein ExbB